MTDLSSELLLVNGINKGIMERDPSCPELENSKFKVKYTTPPGPFTEDEHVVGDFHLNTVAMGQFDSPLVRFYDEISDEYMLRVDKRFDGYTDGVRMAFCFVKLRCEWLYHFMIVLPFIELYIVLTASSRK
eukprot:Nk52_evm5s313 gene=Nk52_evmTU5s313